MTKARFHSRRRDIHSERVGSGILRSLMIALIAIQLLVLPPTIYMVAPRPWIPLLSFVAPGVATIYIWARYRDAE